MIKAMAKEGKNYTKEEWLSEGQKLLMLLSGLGFLKMLGEKKMLNENEVRNALSKGGFDVINFMKNIPNGYIATGDKR